MRTCFLLIIHGLFFEVQNTLHWQSLAVPRGTINV